MCWKRKSDKGKIYKTTDGYFTQNPKQKKPRNVVVYDQRKDDGALAVCKIYSKDGKSGPAYVDGFTLSAADHPALTKESIVGNQVLIATKDAQGNYKPIFKGDLVDTGDKLTKKEHRALKKKGGGATKKYKKTTKKKIKKWKRHFK